MMPQGALVTRTKATNFERFAGAFIDGVILLPIYFGVAFVTATISVYLAPAVVSIIGAAWWLLRDAKHLSIGKKVMGLEVISKSGGTATEDQLMKRNYTLAGGTLLGAIPMIGGLGGLINLIECILLIAKGERYGDQMAETMVVKK